MIISPLSPFSAKINLPGDKSISHRLVLASLLVKGKIEITNLSNCQDVLTSLEIVKSLGVKVKFVTQNHIELTSHNLDNPAETKILNCQNSGTTARLLCGILSGIEGNFELHGDQSLSQRPMKRVVTPLRSMGANISCISDQDKLPIRIVGTKNLTGIEYCLPIPSAQLKSSLIFAGLKANGTTKIIEPVKSRDHTEILLEKLGFKISSSEKEIIISGKTKISGNWKFNVPGDPSSAAFLGVGAAIIPGSRIEFSNCLLNPTRIEFLSVLEKMGAKISIIPDKPETNFLEKTGTVTIEASNLNGIQIGGKQIPLLVDEIPALAVAMACANGNSTVTDAKELRYKESDRISALKNGLINFGIDFVEFEDGFKIVGSAEFSSPNFIDSQSDHRIAMALSVMAAAGKTSILVKNPEIVEISWPDFFNALKKLN